MTYIQPPAGWFTFGHHAHPDRLGEVVEFSPEVGADGYPLWERPIPRPAGVRFEYADGTLGPVALSYLGNSDGTHVWAAVPVEHRPDAQVAAVHIDVLPDNTALHYALYRDGRVKT